MLPRITLLALAIVFATLCLSSVRAADPTATNNEVIYFPNATEWKEVCDGNMFDEQLFCAKFAVEDSRLFMSITVRRDQWVAVGFSQQATLAMFPAFVISCSLQNGQPLVLEGHTKAYEPVQWDETPRGMIHSWIVTDTHNLINMSRTIADSEMNFVNSSSYTQLLWAIGAPHSGPNTKHINRGVLLVNFLNGDFLKPEDKTRKYRYGHGLGLAGVFLFLLAVTVLIARLGRTKCCIVAHGVVGAFTTILVFVGFGLAAYRMAGASISHVSLLSGVHLVFGVLVMIALISLLFTGSMTCHAYNPDAEPEKRTRAARIHVIVGWVTCLFAVITSYVGLSMMFVVNWVWITVTLWLAVIFLVVYISARPTEQRWQTVDSSDEQ